MKKLIDKGWNSISEYGSVFFYLFLVIFMYLLHYNELFLILIISLLISYIVSIAIRIIYFKPRPKKQKYNDWIEKIDASSFPSMHAMRTSILFITFTMFFKKIDIGVLFLIISLIVAISRNVIKKHFWTDIIAGYIFGIIIGYTIFILF